MQMANQTSEQGGMGFGVWRRVLGVTDLQRVACAAGVVAASACTADGSVGTGAESVSADTRSGTGGEATGTVPPPGPGGESSATVVTSTVGGSSIPAATAASSPTSDGTEATNNQNSEAVTGSVGASDSEGTSAPTTTSVTNSCAQPSPRVTKIAATNVAEMGTPFDADENDTIGPADWNSNYGAAPELVVASTGSSSAGGFDVLWRDTAETNRAFVVHVDGSEGQSGEIQYAITSAYQVETLGQLMGLARDEEGNYFFATGVAEDDQITVEDPAEGEYRPDIVRLTKFDANGCVLWETDVDVARGAADSEAEPIVNPMVAATSRLAYGGGQLALVHGINTAPDDNGTRHQKALTTHFDASDGAISRTSGLWVSHSFDQRLLWDGQGFVDFHLGDAYPRAVVMSRATDKGATEGYELFLPKGEVGDNATYTQLGALVQVATGTFGYWAFLSTDRSAQLATEDWQALVGYRDVALVRVSRDFADGRPQDKTFLEDTGTVLEVTSGGQAVTNPLRWLTDFAASDAAVETHAGRVRAVATDDRVVVLWEQWQPGQRSETFNGTFALELDLDANIATPAKSVSERHIPRGDDAFAIDGQAALLLGDANTRSLTLQLLGAGLAVRSVTLP